MPLAKHKISYIYFYTKYLKPETDVNGTFIVASIRIVILYAAPSAGLKLLYSHLTTQNTYYTRKFADINSFKFTINWLLCR